MQDKPRKGSPIIGVQNKPGRIKLLTVGQNITEYSTHWFRAYNRSDFKEYLKITSYLEA
ncbi:uncharacterized protein METZ01_LOCUS235404, partial [marine metagenome]